MLDWAAENIKSAIFEQFNKMTDIIGFAYATVVAIGGVMGYMKAGK